MTNLKMANVLRLGEVLNNEASIHKSIPFEP